jgi:hypothetical protein
VCERASPDSGRHRVTKGACSCAPSGEHALVNCSDDRTWLGTDCFLGGLPAPAIVVLARDCLAVAGDSTRPVVIVAAVFAGLVAGS